MFFKWEAINVALEYCNGVIEADSVMMAYAKLEEQNLYPRLIKEISYEEFKSLKAVDARMGAMSKRFEVKPPAPEKKPNDKKLVWAIVVLAVLLICAIVALILR